jgi:hypothetical protein
VPACHAAQLVERVMDGISVLEHVERDDNVRPVVGHRDAFVEIGDDVRRWMNVQADVPDGMSFECLAERLVPASDIKHCATPNPRICAHDALRFLQRAASGSPQNPDPFTRVCQRHAPDSAIAVTLLRALSSDRRRQHGRFGPAGYQPCTQQRWVRLSGKSGEVHTPPARRTLLG